MIHLDIVETAIGKKAITFNAYNPETGESKPYVLWFDEIDKHLVLQEKVGSISKHLTLRKRLGTVKKILNRMTIY